MAKKIESVPEKIKRTKGFAGDWPYIKLWDPVCCQGGPSLGNRSSVSK